MTPKITSYVPQAIKAVTAGTEKALLETVVKVTTQAKELAPVDLGELKGSLMWKTQTSDGLHTKGDKLTEPVKGLSAISGSASDHAVYQEMGTRFMPPQSFLRVAVAIVTNGASYSQEVAKTMAYWVKNILPKGTGGAGLF